MPANNTTRPVQLQVALDGVWQTILHFDAGDATAADKVQQGALMLHEANPNASFRIATHDRHRTVLRHMGNSTYGIWMDSKGAV